MERNILFEEFEEEASDRIALLDNDELSPAEEAFLRGYEDAG